MNSLVVPVTETQQEQDKAKLSQDMFLLAAECYSQFCQATLDRPNGDCISVYIGKKIYDKANKCLVHKEGIFGHCSQAVLPINYLWWRASEP